LEDQIAKCTITSPADGTVVYAHERDWGGDSSFIVKEGTVIRERQVIINLPDPDSMQVELTINESLIQFLKEGMSARVAPVGFGDRVLQGKVIKINQYAEPTGWRKANVKEYKAKVSIQDSPVGLRPGMTASVTVLCEHLDDALQVPVQAVYAHGDLTYCFVYSPTGKWEARKVVCGPTNDKFYVIESGLEPAERVALNPRRYLDQVELPQLAPEREQRAVAQSPALTAEDATTSDEESNAESSTAAPEAGG
jgi:hypothetical protein